MSDKKTTTTTTSSSSSSTSTTTDVKPQLKRQPHVRYEWLRRRKDEEIDKNSYQSNDKNDRPYFGTYGSDPADTYHDESDDDWITNYFMETTTSLITVLHLLIYKYIEETVKKS